MAFILAGQHRVWPRARRNQHRTRGKAHLAAVAALQIQRRRMAGLIDLDRNRAQSLGEADAFLEGLFHFLMVQRVAG